jgi:geranylgeranyl reductase family protein
MYDVLVIGAGPAGSMAARELAHAGAAVALVDGSHPREKPCGGGVTARALALAGLSEDGAQGHVVTSARFEAAGRRADVSLGGPDTLRIFPRETFDAALRAQAIAAGAVPIEHRAAAVERRGHAWQVAAGAERLEGRWLVGADGPCGITRKHVARPFDRRELSIASGAFVDGASTSEIALTFTAQPSGYLWSFPRHTHLAVGACAQADVTSARDLHALTDRWLDSYEPAAHRPRLQYSWPIPSIPADAFGSQPTAGDGWLLAGDAAGLVDPITREGIYFALESGMAAAAVLGGRDPAREYDARLRDGVHRELRHAASLKAAVFDPRFTGLLIEALDSSAAIRAVMIDLIAGRQPYAGLKRRLIGTLEFGLMARLFWSRV